MNRIQKVSSYLIVVFNIILIAMPLFIVSLWLLKGPSPLKDALSNGFSFGITTTGELSTVKWTPLTTCLGCAAHLLSIVPILLGILILKSIFQNYKKGRIFTVYNARRYTYLGWTFFLDAFFTKPLSSMLMTLATTLSNPPGQRMIHISFGTPNLDPLFCGVLVLVISWIMLEASKLQEDQALVI